MERAIKTCQNCEKDFIIEPDDFSFYEKINVPPPTFCPECRLTRRMSWRNERSLYKGKCKASGHNENVITMYDPSGSYTVFDNKYWWGDEWDSLNYGIELDFSKPFLEQFSELIRNVPLAALSTLNSVNSEYTNFVDGNKNCYLIFGSGWNENVRYGAKLMSCKDSQDIFVCKQCELSYECEGCYDSNRIAWCRNSKNCINSCFLYNCRNCSDCFGCANLVSKSYCIWNKQYSKVEYFEELKKIKISSYNNFIKVRRRFIDDIYLSSLHRYANVFSCVNSTGDNISNCKNCKNCFDIYQKLEDSKYQYASLNLKDTYDGNGIFENELTYECVDCNVGNKNLSSITIYSSNDIYYSFNCHSSKKLFGSIGLRSKQYCILNRQYTKDEYEELVPKIIKHMSDMPYIDQKGRVYKYGEFFPSELSPFCYNETIAQEYFPLAKEQAISQGYRWKDKEERNYSIDIYNKDIPDNIEDIQDDITDKIIECAHKGECNQQCTEAFKIIPEELQFYRRMNLPLPRLCPNCRHYERLSQRNPLKLWHRKCMKEGCTNEFETSYSPDRPEIIYCESCYQKEVY